MNRANVLPGLILAYACKDRPYRIFVTISLTDGISSSTRNTTPKRTHVTIESSMTILIRLPALDSDLKLSHIHNNKLRITFNLQRQALFSRHRLEVNHIANQPGKAPADHIHQVQIHTTII